MTKRLVIIDGDMRNPSVGRMFGFEGQSLGLSDYFDGKADVEEIMIKSGNLSVISAGTRNGGISGIISDSKMQDLMEYLRRNFDFIVIDTPPAGLFSDADILAKYADTVLYVVRYDHASVKEIQEGMSSFIQNNKLSGYVDQPEPWIFIVLWQVWKIWIFKVWPLWSLRQIQTLYQDSRKRNEYRRFSVRGGDGMKNKLIVTFFLLILCAGSVTTALKSFDNVQNNIETAKKIQTARLEAAKVTPTPTPETQGGPGTKCDTDTGTGGSGDSGTYFNE